MPDAGWAAVLEELEQRLAAGWDSDWVPPTGLGPIPPELASRARALLAAQQDAIVQAEGELSRIGRELTGLRRPVAAGGAESGAYIDTVA